MMSPHEIDSLADAIADRLQSRLSQVDAMIDVHAVAELLGCSVPTVERLTRSGEIPSHKVGRLRRYLRSEVLSRKNEKGGPDHDE